MYIYTCRYTHIHVNECACLYVWMDGYMYVCMHAFICMCVRDLTDLNRLIWQIYYNKYVGIHMNVRTNFVNVCIDVST